MARERHCRHRAMRRRARGASRADEQTAAAHRRAWKPPALTRPSSAQDEWNGARNRSALRRQGEFCGCRQTDGVGPTAHLAAPLDVLQERRGLEGPAALALAHRRLVRLAAQCAHRTGCAKVRQLREPRSARAITLRRKRRRRLTVRGARAEGERCGVSRFCVRSLGRQGRAHRASRLYLAISAAVQLSDGIGSACVAGRGEWRCRSLHE